MSGFAATHSVGEAGDDALLRRRGPERTASLEAGGLTFVHHRAPACRDEQPVVSGDVVCLYDGVFFGLAPDRAGEEVVELWRHHGADFARHLDGEYAVAIYDLGRRTLTVATDAFATKPLYRHGVEVASYRSALGGGERVPPNTVVEVGLDDGEVRARTVAPFDFSDQHKERYDDWIAAFDAAVAKRAAAPGVYLALSAGYDSGAIDCALGALGIERRAFSIEGMENLELLRRRLDGDGELHRMDDAELARWRGRLDGLVEPASCRVTTFEGKEETYEVLDDPASCGLALIHSRARERGLRVFLSGQGPDETIAANRHWPGGFPRELRPWPDFAASFQTAYLAKEEHVAGAYGIEVRHPFLDRRLVQEFLWLSAEAKNRRYKAPLHAYLTRHGYPFDEGVKTGFIPILGYTFS